MDDDDAGDGGGGDDDNDDSCGCDGNYDGGTVDVWVGNGGGDGNSGNSGNVACGYSEGW